MNLRGYDNLTRLLIAYVQAFINHHRSPDLFGLPDLDAAEQAWRRADAFNVSQAGEMSDPVDAKQRPDAE
jgi:hypothetical protein